MIKRPILFSGPMVRAILEGRKTQTRRVVKSPSTKHQDVVFVFDDINNAWWPFFSDDGESSVTDDGMEAPIECPYGKPGDRLWVREAWRVHGGREYEYQQDIGQVMYRATHDGPLTWESYQWRPSIHMPRWASRITLEVTAVRVERLQDINEADAWAEGVLCDSTIDYRSAKTEDGAELHSHAVDLYRELWEQINGPGSWELNPWVWVVEFKRVTP